MKWVLVSLAMLIVSLPSEAARARILIDGPPGNHVEIRGTTIYITLPVDVIVTVDELCRMDLLVCFVGERVEIPQELKDAIRTKKEKADVLFKQNIEKRLNAEPPYRGCYRFRARVTGNLRFLAEGEGYASHDSPYHMLRVSQDHSWFQGNAYPRTLRGGWQLSEGTSDFFVLLEGLFAFRQYERLLGAGQGGPYAQKLGDIVNALYKKKTGQDLPGCIRVRFERTENLKETAGNTFKRRQGKTSWVATLGPDEHGILRGSGIVWEKYQQYERHLPTGQWRRATQRLKRTRFKIKGRRDGDRIQLKYEYWLPVKETSWTSKKPEKRVQITKKCLCSTAIYELSNSRYYREIPDGCNKKSKLCVRWGLKEIEGR